VFADQSFTKKPVFRMQIGGAKDCIAEQAGTIAGRLEIMAVQRVEGQPGDTFSGLTDLPCLFDVYLGNGFDGVPSFE
jgi:hypothetical protein